MEAKGKGKGERERGKERSGKEDGNRRATSDACRAGYRQACALLL